MYSLVRNSGAREVSLIELPSLAAAVVIAELFYKFHSFSLECLAFLATWFVLSAGLHLVLCPGAAKS
jgi:hypothetical protein